ncbi:MAG: anti-sigma factor antagonist [candidate division KSB1 bacterium]|nr:anti-sigma factor antagonist [candidate division KSB1 bacterium]MDZ7311404.1 anti-sigma factor antagonist [candidate division KSB1 bacterium]
MERRLVEAVEITENQIHIVCLKGIFDASTVNEFEKVISYLLVRNFYKIVVDLSSVEFISSAGWGAFTAELRRVRQNDGDIKLAAMSPDLFDVFSLLELDSFISAYETVDEAVTAFTLPAPVPEKGAVPQTEFVLPPVVEELKMAPAAEVTEKSTPSEVNATAPAFQTPSGGNGIDMQKASQPTTKTVEVGSAGSAAWSTATNAVGGTEQHVADSDIIEIESNGAEPSLPVVSNLEMWELLIADRGPTIDPYIGKRPMLAEGKTSQEAHALGVEAQQAAPPSLKSQSELLPYEPMIDIGPHSDEFTGLIPSAELDYSGHEPIFPTGHDASHDFDRLPAPEIPEKEPMAGTNRTVEDLSVTQSSKDDARSSVNNNASAGDHIDDYDDEFETQDIRDPWILEEIDTLPEEYEMDDALEEAEQPIEALLLTNKLESQTTSQPVFAENKSGQNEKLPQTANEYETFLKPGVLEAELRARSFYKETVSETPVEPAVESESQSQTPPRPDVWDMDLSYPPLFYEENWEAPAESESRLEDELVPRAEITTSRGQDRDRQIPPVQESHTPPMEKMEDLSSEPADTRADISASGRSQHLAAPPMQMNDGIVELIQSVVSAHPHYGPTMICKYLETRIDPPVVVSRSTVYRYLREMDLNTREKRFEYAGQKLGDTQQLDQ